MTTDADTTDVRLGRLEGRAEEQSLAINQLDDTLQQISATVDEICARIDRLTYMIMGIGGSVIAIEIGITITLILQRSP